VELDCAPNDASPTVQYNYPDTGDDPGYAEPNRQLTCGGVGWFISSNELASVLTHLRNTEELLSAQARAIMQGEFLGFMDPANYGCGSGKASVELHRLGYEVFLIDFTDNCRDEEAVSLPFLEWDLTRPIPAFAPFGLCCDVMEHIPTGDVDAVITNIMASADTVFFQIATTDDDMGELIGAALHMTVKPVDWWLGAFNRLGYAVTWHTADDTGCRIIATFKD